MNKKSKNGLLIFGVIVIIGLLGFLVYKVATPQATVGGNTIVGSGGGNGVTISTAIPTLTYTCINKLSTAGTSCVPSAFDVTDSANPVYLSTAPSTGTVGQKLHILWTNNTVYHNTVTDYVVKDGANQVQAPLVANGTLTMAVYNTGKSAMTNNGGATNQTVASGGAYTMELDLTGQSLKSTSDLRCVLEGNSSTKFNKLQLNGFGATFVGTSKPASYTGTSTNSAYWVYDIPAITDANLKVGSIYAESKTGQSLADTFFRITCYSKEWFLDTNTGAFTYDIEDSLGTAKSMNSYTFTGAFT